MAKKPKSLTPLLINLLQTFQNIIPQQTEYHSYDFIKRYNSYKVPKLFLSFCAEFHQKKADYIFYEYQTL